MMHIYGKWLAGCATALALAGCAGDSHQPEEPHGSTSTAYASAGELVSFCDRLPRAAWGVFEKHPSSNDWFEVYAIESGIYAIYEPFQWQEVISWLIEGDEMALLFDTGNGIGDIGAVVATLTDLPVTVLNSHSHFDHTGGNYQFDHILSLGTPFSLERSLGYQTEEVLAEVSPEALCKPLPDGLKPKEHRIRPYPITGKIADGDVIDLGGRQLEVLYTPGHTPDAIALLDRDAGFLWSGDSFYEGPIWLFTAETDLRAYRKSVRRLAEIAPELNAVFPAHNTPRANPDLLVALRDKVEIVTAGRVEPLDMGDGTVEFAFAGFSLLMRADYYRIEDGESDR